jgi:putative drug exporter of the RND superfamily
MTERAIAHITGTGPSLVIHVAGDPRSPHTRNAIVQATRSLTALDGIVSVRSVSSNTRRVSAELMATDGKSSLTVAGEAAEDVDFTNSLTHRLPLSLAVVVLLTSLLLWALTGSVVLPLKAIAVTTISLGASMGFLVWGFQNAHLSGLLNFTPVGGLEPVIVVLTCLFAFGLSTDYEVFLLSAIIEARDRGLTTKLAVIDGIERTGKIITTAALLLLVVFVGFATGGLLIVKQLGVGLAAAILIDATVVRLVLVPASLTLLKSKNWWSPKWLRQLHRRLHLNQEIS